MRVTSKSTDVEARDHSEVTYRIEDIHRLSQVLGSPGLSAWWARIRTVAAQDEDHSGMLALSFWDA